MSFKGTVVNRHLVPVLTATLMIASCADSTRDDDANAGGGGDVSVGGSGGGGSGGMDPAVCGDGVIDAATEDCDDGNASDGDGCAATCDLEPGYDCTGEPSTCTTTCGDGVVAGGEDCDDDNVANLDGCSSMCSVETGWDCGGASPSVCVSDCGDGVIALGAEACDDQNGADDDGCSGTCEIEPGWSCMGEPSECETGCGDGIIAGTETCDDSNMVDADGCSSACAVESGYVCEGEPSTCELAGTCVHPIVVTGDGFVWQAPLLDPHGDDLANTDGSCASASSSTSPKPDVVFTVDLGAGDRLHVAESGDADVLMHVLDGACASASACLASFDGIGGSEIDPGLVFTAPSAGSFFVVIDTWGSSDPGDDVDLLFEISTCGDGVIGFGEVCDDNNANAGDGCSTTCTVEPGFECTGEPSTCGALPGFDCANAIVASDGFTHAGQAMGAYGDLYDFTDPSCSDVSGSPNASPEIVFSIELTAGQTVNVKDFGTLDVVFQLIAPTCASGQACLATFDGFNADEQAQGLSYTAAADGTFYVVVESYAATPSPTSTFDIRFEVATCGDGVTELSETCDDDNTDPDDGCSPLCRVEPGYACTGSPSTCEELEGSICASAIVAADDFTFTGTNIVPFGDDYNFSDASCQDVGGTPNASPEMVFQIDLEEGDRLNVSEHGTLDVVIQVTQGACGAGACLARLDSGETVGLTFVAPATDTYFVVVESYSASPPTSGTYDVRFDVIPCGDGTVTPPEGCDDGNDDANDGCSPSCVVESGYSCVGSPSVCTPLPAASCSEPLLVTSNSFEYAGTNIAAFGDDENFNAGAGCVDVSTSSPSGFDLVFRVDVEAGDTVRVRELGTLDAVLHILEQPSCGAGTTCGQSTDFNETVGIAYTAPAAGPVFVVVESWGNPSASTTFDVRIDRLYCGDGSIDGNEQCDDANGDDFDGCSATCTVEPGYLCQGEPSECSTPEVNCNDGVDNNGDGDIDGADPTCALPGYFPACGAGEALLVYPSGDLALPIPDNQVGGGATHDIAVSGVTGLIQRAATVFTIAHTWDSDVGVFLTPPGSAELGLSTGNGASGDNYIDTVLDSTCATPVTAGTAPFSGCYAPEESLALLSGSSPNGSWTVRVSDSAASDVGTLEEWILVLCVQ